MPFTPKNWQDAPSTATPLTAVAIEDLETRVTDYTDVGDVVLDGRLDLVEGGTANVQPVFNVKKYGAVGDGVADDSPWVQDAVDAAVAAGGGVVYFPDGVYKHVSTITLAADGVHFVGAGRFATKVVCPVGNIGFDIGDGATQYHYISFGKMQITRITAGGAITVKMRKVDQFRFDDCDVAAGTVNIDLTEPITGVISSCGINSCTVQGIRMDNGDQILITNNTFETSEAATTHIKVESACKACAITGNVFSSATKAIYSDGGQSFDFAITGNVVENCDYGFQLAPDPSGLTRSVIAGNAMRGVNAASSWGIAIYGTRNTIVGNVVTNYVTDILETGSGPNANTFACNQLDNIFQPVGANTTGFLNDRGESAIRMGDPTSFRFGTSTGTKMGDGSTQKLGFWGATPVVRPTGWGAPTGTPTRTTFATSTVTLPQLAERVKALIDDLTTEGLIGA